MNLTIPRPRPVPAHPAALARATPLWFGPPQRPLFGWVHTPRENRARGAAVLCAPLFGEQDIAAYTLGRLAAELAGLGVLAIRFDYDGTADSSGSERDGRRVEAWRESVAHTVALAKDCGAPSVTLVGMRAGALMAASMAHLPGVGSLVLWDPCESGRHFVRQQQALQRLAFPDTVHDEDAVELPGFVASKETARDLGDLRSHVLGSAVSHALVLTRPATPIPGPLASDLANSALDRSEALGQAELLEGNGERQEIPLSTISHIAHWVAQRGTDDAFVAAVPNAATVVLGGSDQHPITETAQRLGTSGLFAIRCGPQRPAVGPAVVLVNNGFGSHIGPSRLWVELAHEWARHGIRSWRIELSGIGDSPARAGRPEHVVYSPAAFDDVCDVHEALVADDAPSIVWIGLCSGAYQALEAAVAHGALGACVVNPVLRFSPPETFDGPLDPRRRIARPTTNVSRLARRLPDLPLIGRARMEALREVGLASRARRARSWPDALMAAGSRVVCICGEDEARAVRVELDAAQCPEGVEIRLHPGLDHALIRADQRRSVAQEMTRFVLDTVATAHTVDPTSSHPSSNFAP